MAGLIGMLIVTGVHEGVDKYQSRRAMKRRATQPTVDSDEMPVSYDEAVSSAPRRAGTSSSRGESSSMAVAEKERSRAQERHRRRTVDDVLAQDEAPPPYHPPTYTERAPSPTPSAIERSQTASSSHDSPSTINLNTTSISAPLPARPPPPRELGSIQRADGRRPCRVNSDGSCACGKQQRTRSPGAPEKESEEARLERKRKEMWNVKGAKFWNTMGMGFLRGFLI